MWQRCEEKRDHYCTSYCICSTQSPSYLHTRFNMTVCVQCFVWYVVNMGICVCNGVCNGVCDGVTQVLRTTFPANKTDDKIINFAVSTFSGVIDDVHSVRICMVPYTLCVCVCVCVCLSEALSVFVSVCVCFNEVFCLFLFRWGIGLGYAFVPTNTKRQ